MTDRELLELAAKAAGYETKEYEQTVIGGTIAAQAAIYCRDGQTVRINWNPLTDDGDALRLAAKLQIIMELRKHTRGLITQTISCDQMGNERVEICPRDYPDICAATRRAIVRAAAEIGRGLAEKPEGK